MRGAGVQKGLRKDFPPGGDPLWDHSIHPSKASQCANMVKVAIGFDYMKNIMGSARDKVMGCVLYKK